MVNTFLINSEDPVFMKKAVWKNGKQVAKLIADLDCSEEALKQGLEKVSKEPIENAKSIATERYEKKLGKIKKSLVPIQVIIEEKKEEIIKNVEEKKEEIKMNIEEKQTVLDDVSLEKKTEELQKKAGKFAFSVFNKAKKS